MNAPSRRERNKVRTRAAILDAAASCIAAEGVHAATMDQIAATAHISRATLFNYFASKAEVVASLVDAKDAEFYRAMASWRARRGLSTAERLFGLFAATARYLGAASPIERILVGVSELSWNEAAGLARVRKLIAAFEALLADGRTRDDILPSLNLAVAAEIVAGTYVGMIHQWRLADDYPIVDRLEAAAGLLAAMIAPSPIPKYLDASLLIH